MILRLIFIVYFLIFLAVTGLFAAAFGPPSSLVYIPTATPFTMDSAEISLSAALNTPEKRESDYDLFGTYAPTNFFKVAAGASSIYGISGYAHFNFYEPTTDQPYALGAGVAALSFDGDTHGANSPYIVASSFLKNTALHVGYGGNYFTPQNEAAEETLPPGLFIGMEYNLNQAKIVAEYDGIDVNFGVKYNFNEKTKINVAATEVFAHDGRSSTATPSDEIKKPIHVSASYSFNASDFFNTRTLRDIHGRVKPDAAGPVKAKADTKIMGLYLESFTFYAAGDYYQAIEILKKAIDQNPKLPQLHIRTAQIYYELAFIQEAITHWQKAAALDPTNQELKAILEAFQ